jgi:hypothetical protein
MMYPLDLWVIRGLRTGRTFNGELETLSGPFRPMAECLARVRVDESLTGQERREALAAARAPVWEAMLAAREDRVELVEALAKIDPDGPPPEGTEAADDWPSLALTTLPPAVPFPVGVLPEAAAALVTAGAEAIGCPPDFLALPALVVAAGAAGRSVALLLKEGYFAPASLYGACVGPPSDGKTPGLKAVAAAVRRIDRALTDEYAADRGRWEDEAKRPGPDGKKPDPGPPPRPRRIVVDDMTLESAPLILADNPRGLVMVRDELTAPLLGLNQYKAGGKGSDRPTSLKIWSGDDMIRDRVANPDGVPVRCPAPCLSIVGGLTPDMLGSLADPKGRADGFTDRSLFTYPEPLPVAPWSERGIPEDVAEAWCALVGRLWVRPMALKDGRMVTHVARFTPEGKAAWQERFDAHAAEMNAPDFPPSLRGPWGKLWECAGRLALILACLDHASDPAADPEAVPAVGPRVVGNAWRLVRYFGAWPAGPMPPSPSGRGGGPVVKALADWIREGRRLSFSERDFKQARRWVTHDDLSAALAYLIERHAIRPRDREDRPPRPGRPRSPVYDVNPSLLDTQNPQNTQNPGGDHRFEDSEDFENGHGG